MIGLYSKILRSREEDTGGENLLVHEEMIAAIKIPMLGIGVFRWKSMSCGSETMYDENVRVIKMCGSEARAIETAVRYKIEDEKQDEA